MDSINRNQPEHNREDLRAEDAIEKIQELVAKSPNCFFCTSSAPGSSGGARPMNVRDVDDEGNLWFLSASDSHTNAELALDPRVALYFQGSTHSDFLQIHGQATVSTDRARIRELWEPVIRTWFTGGVDDPRITVIRVVPVGGYYWDTKHGNLVAGMKMLIGSMIRKTLDDSIEGRLDVR
jgi:general stress protein 26